MTSLLVHSHVELARWHKEGSLDAPIAVVISVHSWEGEDSVVVGLELRVSLVDAVVAIDRVESFNDLEQVVVDHRDTVADKELLVAKPFANGTHLSHACCNSCSSVWATESQLHASQESFLNDALEHNDVGALLSILAQKSWAPSVADVDGHGFRLGETEVAIDNVRQVGEIHA